MHIRKRARIFFEKKTKRGQLRRAILLSSYIKQRLDNSLLQCKYTLSS